MCTENNLSPFGDHMVYMISFNFVVTIRWRKDLQQGSKARWSHVYEPELMRAEIRFLVLSFSISNKQ